MNLIMFETTPCGPSPDLLQTEDSEYRNLLPKSDAVYVSQTLQGVSRVQCGLRCLLHNKNCAGMLYNNATEHCKTVKSSLNEQTVDRSRIEIGWELFVHSNGCDSGWILYDGHCYIASPTAMNWMTAELYCESRGAHMVTIDTDEENQWIMDVFVPPWDAAACSVLWRCCNTWIGTSDIDQEGLFTWTQQRSMAYWNWYTDEPNDANGNQDCAALCQNGFWMDRTCTFAASFVCEKD
ncbi:perlucin-like protein [Saccostrea echinata]|uniref:perlucin-like protein n=1 Tax=Saccostrea echinata TaxID=191078 RepID=UPI002A81C71D|nr:perlucin-like protein [Saccostrea echinata]